VAADRVAILRKAFDETMQDPQFLAEAERRELEIVAGRGEDLQRVVAQTVATPPRRSSD
jgi:hypothetical protein